MVEAVSASCYVILPSIILVWVHILSQHFQVYGFARRDRLGYGVADGVALGSILLSFYFFLVLICLFGGLDSRREMHAGISELGYIKGSQRPLKIWLRGHTTCFSYTRQHTVSTDRRLGVGLYTQVYTGRRDFLSFTANLRKSFWENGCTRCSWVISTFAGYGFPVRVRSRHALRNSHPETVRVHLYRPSSFHPQQVFGLVRPTGWPSMAFGSYQCSSTAGEPFGLEFGRRLCGWVFTWEGI